MLDKDPEDYQAEDFAANESFINYWIHRNEQDRAVWEQWLLEHPEKRTAADEAGQMLQMLAFRLTEDDYQKEFRQIEETITSDEASLQKPLAVRYVFNSEQVGHRKRRAALRYFVPLLLIFFVAGYLILRNGNTDEMTQAANDLNTPMIITLSDSTVVTLAPHSSLRYSKIFAGVNRDVYLNGSASFNVTHNAAHPFKVYEDELVTTVLGTIFNIKKDQRDSTISVELLRGKVRVETNDARNATQSIVLNPNEKIVYNENNRSFHKELLLENSRTVQNIKFEKADFSTVAKKFKEAFGFVLINECSIKNWRFTGEFNNATANTLIESICLAENVKYKFQNDTIVVK